MNLFAPNHLILIALVVLLLFGGKKIPELMRGIGKGIKEFGNAKNSGREDEGSEPLSDAKTPVKRRADTPL